MNELREDLDRALRTVTFGEAPVERAKRDGRRIRTRRRVALLAGVLAVAAAAAGYPALARNSAAPPAPASVSKEHGSYDPTLTDGPGGTTTEAADGLASAGGEIAAGTMGGVAWHVSADGQGKANPVPADPCFTVSLALVGDLGGGCVDLPPAPASQLNASDPVLFGGTSDAVTEATIGEAAADVTYLIVTFTDGQRLKLIPVTTHGHRYIAWIAPLTMTIASVVAHLGGPYDDSGATATAMPFDPSGQMPVFGGWQRPGQRVPPRANGAIGGGRVMADHVAWSASAYAGPWGACMDYTAGDSNNGSGTAGYYCMPVTSATPVVIMGPVPSSIAGLRFLLGSAPAGVAEVRVTLSDGKDLTARPVAVGDERLFAVALTGTAGPTGWTSYDAAGRRSGGGLVSSVPANAEP